MLPTNLTKILCMSALIITYSQAVKSSTISCPDPKEIKLTEGTQAGTYNLPSEAKSGDNTFKSGLGGMEAGAASASALTFNSVGFTNMYDVGNAVSCTYNAGNDRTVFYYLGTPKDKKCKLSAGGNVTKHPMTGQEQKSCETQEECSIVCE